MKPLEGQTALVTGGSRGIGAAIAARLARSGADIIVNYLHSKEKAERVAAQCECYGVKALIIQADIRNKEEVERMFRHAEWYGRHPLSMLINNAGTSHYGFFDDVSEEAWDEVIDTHLKGTFLCSQFALRWMLPRHYGRIVNISSIWGLNGASCEVAYSTAKGGLHAFTQALAKEVAPSGITVNAVAPGAVATDMMESFSEKDRMLVEQQIPLGRMAHPDEIASAVHYLCLQEASYITGQIISPNGGWQG